MRVVDTNMNDVPHDMKSIGEIVASCDWLMSGCYKDPEGTAAALLGREASPGRTRPCSLAPYRRYGCLG